MASFLQILLIAIKMKKLNSLLFAGLLSLGALAQSSTNTLLWKISGKELTKPSFLYGTIHLICADEAALSLNFKKAIKDAEEVYFEVDLDNIFEMMGAMNQMKMKGDTTLKDLLSIEEYEKVRSYFESKGSLLPFSMLETFKPMLAASTLEKGSMPCGNTTMMEQVIMEEAKRSGKKVQGLETMKYQASLLDSIPYSYQARQLVEYISQTDSSAADDQMKAMFEAYRDQDLKKLEYLMLETDPGMAKFTDILLFHRNRNWVEKLGSLMKEKSLVIAVGAGHLPGEKGVISLLRAAGYKVEPVENRNRSNKEI